jgi:hypothetical protein
MGHNNRIKLLTALDNKLASTPFVNVSLAISTGEPSIDNEWLNGCNALSSGRYQDSDWHIVLQDDAVISDSFYENALKALRTTPERSLVSFYLGTSVPKKQAVERSLKRAENAKASWLTYDTLLWGVCIAVPSGIIGEMIDDIEADPKTYNQPYDFRIGNWCKRHNVPVYYSVPSIVDHLDEASLLPGKENKPPRKAHRYEPNKTDFNNKVIIMR